MEDTLRGPADVVSRKVVEVLILVLMEDTLRDVIKSVLKVEDAKS